MIDARFRRVLLAHYANPNGAAVPQGTRLLFLSGTNDLENNKA